VPHAGTSLWKLGVIMTLGLSFSACAPLQPKPVAVGLVQTNPALAVLPFWRLQGRVAVQAGEQGWNAHLFWEHDGRQDRVRLSGPFSQGAVSIVLQDDLIYINEGAGVVGSSRDPDGYLRERLGFTVPLASLRYWVLGVPSPKGEPASVFSGAGLARAFSQQGWRLSYERFTRVHDFDLPEKMSVQGQNIKMKLVADEWALN
jgi:outer membrane lipoprotein LolB